MAVGSLKRNLAYVSVLAGCLIAGTLAGWLGSRIDNYAYDTLTRLSPPPDGPTKSVVVAIDEETLAAQGGVRRIRPILAGALQQLADVHPKTVALDVILSDKGDDAEDAQLEAALRNTRNLILPCELIAPPTGGASADPADVWEDPLPRFGAYAVALGHVHPEQDHADGVSRQISLEETGKGPTGNTRRWALSLEAFQLYEGQPITESPDDLEIGSTTIPAPRSDGGRAMLIRYLPNGVDVVPVLKIRENAALIEGKAVFLGVTALSAARDRLVNPYGQNVPGVAVHAHAFETMQRADFLRPASNLTPLAVSGLYALAAGLAFALVSGWASYVAAFALLAFAHILPVALFQQGTVFPYFGPVAVAWLSCIGAATFQYFFVRRQLSRSESEKSRYQQAIHWAAHEMRTPLTAIQGSSEIMTNYALPAAKQKELSEMINSESKRLARLIQTFLDVERLADGQMELKREPFTAASVVDTCLARVTPLAERKRITMSLDTPVDGRLVGDRELMEYAFYNLLTNAVKYSPAETHVGVAAQMDGNELRISVSDQGIGMDAKELKSIFRKFYRTTKAEASGEVGTGIGLSIVEQIVTRHGGRMEVTSEPGKGSCFTMILVAQPAPTTAAGPRAVTPR
jgi:signal transduction histidine kinase